jgi:hypothetical protein
MAFICCEKLKHLISAKTGSTQKIRQGFIANRLLKKTATTKIYEYMLFE